MFIINLLTPIIFIAILFSAFKNGKPICNRYYMNTILYLMFMISIYYNGISIENRYKLLDSDTIFMIGIIIGYILSLFLCIYLLYTTNNIYIQHICLIYIILSLGIFSYNGLYSRILQNKTKEEKLEVLSNIILRLIIILLFTLLLSIYFPKYFGSKIYVVSFVLLIITILFYLLDVIVFKSGFTNIYHYLFILIFAIFLVYDFKYINSRAQSCNGKPDYIIGSLNLFLDIINIFDSLLLLNKE